MNTLAKLLWVEVKLFVREPIAMVFAFAFPLVVLLVLAGVFGSKPNADFGGVAGIDYYVPGYLAVVIASVGLIGLPVHLASLRERGVLRRLRASSVSSAVNGQQGFCGGPRCDQSTPNLKPHAVHSYQSFSARLDAT